MRNRQNQTLGNDSTFRLPNIYRSKPRHYLSSWKRHVGRSFGGLVIIASSLLLLAPAASAASTGLYVGPVGTATAMKN